MRDAATIEASDAFLVYDEDDRVENIRYARGLHDIARQRLVVSITPDTTSLHQLGADLLAGLGKRVDVSGRSTTANETWFRACAWTIGEQIEHLIVCRAHLLAPLRMQRVLEAGHVANASIWLVIHRPTLSRGQRELVRDWRLQEMPFSDFRRRWHDARRHQRDGAVATPPAAFPDVPDEEAPGFLAACRGLLDEDDLRRVQGTYRDAQGRAAAWFRQSRALDDDARLTRFERWMHEQLEACVGLSEMVTVARGIQAAALWHGLWVKVNKPKLAGAFAHTQLAALDARTAVAIRHYSHPRYAASAVCSLALRRPPSAIAALNVGDVGHDADCLTSGSRSFSVPPSARGILRAHRALRLVEGAQPSDPLFVSEKRLVGGRDGRIFGRTTAHGIQQGLQRLVDASGNTRRNA